MALLELEAAKLKPVLRSLNVATNRDMVADANVEKLISLAQGYVSVQKNAAIINADLFLSSKFRVAIQFSK